MFSRIKFPLITQENGTGVLSIFEESNLPFSLRRVFTIKADKDEIRGKYAHKECSQILKCVSGEVDVILKDGFSKEILTLNVMDGGILIPPGIWAEQIYKQDGTVLLVLCDQLYSENDYIRSVDEYNSWVRE